MRQKLAAGVLAGALALVGGIATITPTAEAGFPIPLPMASIGGEVTNILVGGPAAGLSVTLVKDGAPVARTSTDRLGQFSFGALQPGSYTLVPDGGTARSLSVGSFAIFVPLTTTKL